MATHSSILAWRIPRTEEPGRFQFTGVAQSDMAEVTQHTCVVYIYIHTSFVLSHSVMSVSLGPHGLQLARLLSPCYFPGQNTGVGCHFLFHGIFLIQGSNLHLWQLLHWQVDSLPVSHLGSTNIYITDFLFSYPFTPRSSTESHDTTPGQERDDE